MILISTLSLSLSLSLSLYIVDYTYAGSGIGAGEELPPPVLPGNALVLPLVRQQTNYSCGPAALLSALKYWQVFQGTEQDLYSVLGTLPAEGTHPKKLAEGAKTFTLNAEFKVGLVLADLQRELANKSTIILDIQAWPDRPEKPKLWPILLPTFFPNAWPNSWNDRWDDGHYIVMVGMDDYYIYAMDPSTGGAYTYFPINELNERWHDFENEAGKKVEYYHVGILIKGTNPSKLQFETRNLVRLD